MDVNYSSLKHRPVVDAAGTTIGQLHDLVVDTQTWKVTGLVVRLAREAAAALGRRGVFHAPDLVLQIEHVQGARDQVILRDRLVDLQHAQIDRQQPVP